MKENQSKRLWRQSQTHSEPEEDEKLMKKEETGVELLRKVSRQEYLKMREMKKLDELRDDVEEDQYLFRGAQLTDAEHRQQRNNKQIYDLVAKKKKKMEEESDCSNQYTMPESYDHEGRIDQKKRFDVALQRYTDPAKPYADEEAWRDQQIGKSILKFGARDKTQENNYDYEFAFEEQINFVKAGVIAAESRVPLSSTMAENTENERKSLPIYAYKEQLIQAVHDHQVLIIVGETGSGKTTQIPQFLEEAGYTERGMMIGCTQPRRVAAMSVAARVARERGVKLGHEVGYSIRFEDCTSSKTVLKYMTDGRLVHEFQQQLRREPILGSYSVIMVDEAHERSVSTDILFALLKDVARARPDLKLLISSATLDADKLSDFFDSAPIFLIPGRRFPIEMHFTKAPQADYLAAALVTALQIHSTEEEGDILVFLTGQEEIETAEVILRENIRKLGRKIGELIICPIYANLPKELQGKVFEPTPQGARKLVLATNIAETSLTIDGIKYVVDSGFVKLKSYNHRTGMESLLVNPISKASANQRAGRSGRTGPGKCFRLYTAHDYHNELEDNTVPEIQRANLGGVVLTLKRLGVVDLLRLDLMNPPPAEALIKALELLYALGALNKTGELTKLGELMAEFPLDPMMSKMIVASEKYNCVDEILSIAAMLSVGSSIFYRPKEKRVMADNARRNFYVANMGDHVALLNVYTSWKESNFSRQWCYENYVQAGSMRRARDIRDQLEGVVTRVGIRLCSNVNDVEGIRKAIASGYFPNSARMHKEEGLVYTNIKTRQNVYIHPHPTSGVAPRWVVYHELLFTTREYMRQVTEIKPEWLLEIAPHYYNMEHLNHTLYLT
ncbi:RNA helicase family protein [Perilla frutescens var. frutescens]|nr:RNA helicase family protein [Perilla frutescens var. frutescens]